MVCRLNHSDYNWRYALLTYSGSYTCLLNNLVLNFYHLQNGIQQREVKNMVPLHLSSAPLLPSILGILFCLPFFVTCSSFIGEYFKGKKLRHY